MSGSTPPSSHTQDSGNGKGEVVQAAQRTIEENLALLKSAGEELADQIENAFMVMQHIELETDTRNEILAQSILALETASQIKSRLRGLRYKIAATAASGLKVS